MPYTAPTPPLTPDGSPPPAVDAVFHGGLPPLAMPPPRPAAAWPGQPGPNLAWLVAGRLLITVLHGMVVVLLGIAALFVMAFNDDPPPDQNIGVFLLTVLLIAGTPAGALVVLTGGMWFAKRWAYWGMLVLYSAFLGFVAVAWSILLSHAGQWTLGLLAPIAISVAIPMAVLSYLVMTWPKKQSH